MKVIAELRTVTISKKVLYIVNIIIVVLVENYLRYIVIRNLKDEQI